MLSSIGGSCKSQCEKVALLTYHLRLCSSAFYCCIGLLCSLVLVACVYINNFVSYVENFETTLSEADCKFSMRVFCL